ncbi:hypothetical protein [Hyalangium versicolor]|uniref:hypothetical protein n=1 Tax=Hyalangium versicolor TaxID=2861190 RepID=UPI001CCD0C83|nr:hypothetical protein [Hyalangium versicolor]
MAKPTAREEPTSERAAGTPSKPSEQRPPPAGTPELRLQVREVVVHGWHNGGVETFLVDEDAALKLVLPEAKGCQPEYRTSVGGETRVLLYQVKNVRQFLPWGAAVPVLPPSAILQDATSGTIVCTAIPSTNGQPGVRITLKNLRFPSSHVVEVGPVEGTPAIPPP